VTDEIEEALPEAGKAESGDRIHGNPLVLVAEDDPVSRLLIKTIMKQLIQGVRVIETANGLEALAAYKEKSPDFILMDVQMPEMDGLEVTKNIRNFENTRGKHVPIIALSAGVIKEEQETCFKAGMDDFLAKPVDRKVLKNILNKYLE
jgi:CheY-like chemotaxis protein